MDAQEKAKHNQQVVKEAIQSLFDHHLVDPVKFVSDPEYGQRKIYDFLICTNIARTKMMGLDPIRLYNLNEEED